MPLFENLVKTYDAYEKMGNMIGVRQESGFTLAPVAHTTFKPSIVITLDDKGNFISAEKYDEKLPAVVIPGNENAEKRSGLLAATSPYSLCDKLKYMVKGTKSYESFIDLLSAWNSSEFSHPVLASVEAYLEKGSIVNDLTESGLIKKSFGGEKIAWKFVGFSDNENNAYCWTIKSLMKSWTDYYLDYRSKNGKTDLCMITGEYVDVADFHPKNLVPGSANGKLISSSKKNTLTYAGRFSTKSQANSIGYVASQKMHNTLRFLASEQGVRFGLSDFKNGKVFICWNPSGVEIGNPGGRDFYGDDCSTTLDMVDYKNQLQKALTGYRNTLKDNNDNVVVASFESSGDGRLSVTDYAEININEYFDNLFKWDEECCFQNYVYGIQTPSLTKIIEFAYGHPKKGSSELIIDDGVKFSKLHSLINGRIYGGRIQSDIVKALADKVSRLYLYDNKNWIKKYGTTQREALLTTACSVIRKYYIDHGKEIEMSLQTDNNDLSYLYGRLLAVMERIEKAALNGESQREANAIKLQSRFVKTPLSTARIVQEKLTAAYLPKLKDGRRVYFEKLMGEIMDKIGEHDEKELNRPLKDIYIIGYYQQRNAFYTTNKSNEDTAGDRSNDSVEEIENY